MKKRVLAALLCVVMTATLLVGCGDSSTNNSGSEANTGSTQQDTSKDTEKDTSAGNTGAELSVEPYKYYPFDSTDEGWKVVVADASKAANNAYDVSNLDSSTARGIVDGDMSSAQFLNGVAGKSVFMDRTYAIDLNFEPTNTDAYTISFWVYTTGMSNYMPSLQIGNNIGYAAGAGNNVTWLNVTQTDWVGATYPIIWSRNEASAALNADGTVATDCFPWMSAYDTEKLIYGYKEWVNITIVATGDIYTAPVGIQAAGCQLYINGELRYDSYDNFMNGTYFEITDTEANATYAPNIMKPADGQTFEAYFGINYWDTMFQGCVDELYIFDEALSASDVAALYAKGDPTVDPGIDSSLLPQENPRELLGENSVGANNYTQGFWTTFSDIMEVPEGTTKTITFKNYHTNLSFANWNNATVILQNTATGHANATDNPTGIDPVDGYKEYLVGRMDNYAWNAVTNTGTEGQTLCTATCDWNWDTFKDATHGATVVLKVTNNGTTADVVMEITATDGTVYHQSYTGIAVDGPVYCCLTVEKACIDILSVE